MLSGFRPYAHTRVNAVPVVCATLFFLTFAAVSAWPVDVFTIREQVPGSPESRLVLSAPTLLGRDVTASIIHSVQLTPVIDVYRIQEGRIWSWQEKIMSHNAGLPSLKPERGRFIYDTPWMIVEGGGVSHATIYYRVGDEQFGRNVLCVFPLPCHELWREMPGKRLVLEAKRGYL